MYFYEVIFTNGFRGEYGSFDQDDEELLKHHVEVRHGEGTVKSVKFLEFRDENEFYED